MRNKPQTEIEPGELLYNLVRSIFTRRGSSLNAWCDENDVDLGTAKQALFGYSKSDNSRTLRDRLIRAAGLDGSGEKAVNA